jgi:membrane-bound ClpP family serine protease
MEYLFFIGFLVAMWYASKPIRERWIAVIAMGVMFLIISYTIPGQGDLSCVAIAAIISGAVFYLLKIYRVR